MRLRCSRSHFNSRCRRTQIERRRKEPDQCVNQSRVGGCPPLEYIDATKLRAPVLGHWGTQDEFFPIAAVDSLENKLREAGAEFDFHRYLSERAILSESNAEPPREVGRQRHDNF